MGLARRGQGARRRRCRDIDSSSRLDLGSVALPTNVTVFMKVSTKPQMEEHPQLLKSLTLQPHRLRGCKMVGPYHPEEAFAISFFNRAFSFSNTFNRLA